MIDHYYSQPIVKRGQANIKVKRDDVTTEPQGELGFLDLFLKQTLQVFQHITFINGNGAFFAASIGFLADLDHSITTVEDALNARINNLPFDPTAQDKTTYETTPVIGYDALLTGLAQIFWVVKNEAIEAIEDPALPGQVLGNVGALLATIRADYQALITFL